MNLDPTNGLVLFTDGSAWSKDRIGGWAWVAIDAGIGEESDMGWNHDTTNNRMEMTAWIEGLNALYKEFGPCTILVYSDSEYVGLGVTIRTRSRRNNVDLWPTLDEAFDQHEYVEFCHVRGHGDSYYNDMVDQLAGEARLAGQWIAEAEENEAWKYASGDFAR